VKKGVYKYFENTIVYFEIKKIILVRQQIKKKLYNIVYINIVIKINYDK
jgi:DNA-dependent RNA polymerase auxiliary subunit epsilon